MLDSSDETASEPNKAAAVPTDPTVPEIKAQPADAILGPAPVQKREEESMRKASPLIGRLLRFGLRLATAACLVGLGWAGGFYSARGYSLFDVIKPNPATEVQQSAGRDEIDSTVQQMGEEIRALKSDVEALHTAQGPNAEDTKNRENLKTQLDTVQTTTSAAIADLSGRVDKLETESTTKLSHLSDQLDGLEHRIAAPRATVAAAAPPSRKRVEHPNDAFDPSQHAAAPGAPRPLGSPMNANSTGGVY